MSRPALFLDRDGVLNRMVYDATHGLFDSPRRVEQLEVMPGAAELLRLAAERGYVRVVVTNQPGIAKGTLTFPELETLHRVLAAQLAPDGRAWEACYVCPHHPQPASAAAVAEYVKECDCRKPAPGLLLQAAADLDLDLSRSWMIGDGVVDIRAGHAAGCRTIWMSTLKPEHLEHFFHVNVIPDRIVSDLWQAAAELESALSAPSSNKQY